MKSVRKLFNYGNYILPIEKEVNYENLMPVEKEVSTMIEQFVSSKIKKQLYNPEIYNMQWTISFHIRNKMYLGEIK